MEVFDPLTMSLEILPKIRATLKLVRYEETDIQNQLVEEFARLLQLFLMQFTILALQFQNATIMTFTSQVIL